MIYRFSFISTTKDLLDAYEASSTLRRSVQPFFRFLLLLLGLLWAVGPVIAVFVGVPLRFDFPGVLTDVLVWLGGCAIVWYYMIQPMRKRRQVRRKSPPEQDVVVEFSEDTLTIQALGAPNFHRSWEEVAAAVPCKKGMLFSFTDGTVNWLPKRVFSNDEELKSFQHFVDTKIKGQKA
mgnify:CR=1 FL=1